MGALGGRIQLVMFRCVDGYGWRGCSALIELAQGEAHRRIAGDLWALADEVPGLGRWPLAREFADQIIDFDEQPSLLHRISPLA